MNQLFFRKSNKLATLANSANLQSNTTNKTNAVSAATADNLATPSATSELDKNNIAWFHSNNQTKPENDFAWLAEAEKNLRWAS